MIRILLEVLVPLLLPTGIYLAWLAAMRRRAARGGRDVPAWVEAPWPLLGFLGILLAATITIAVNVSNRMPIEGTYIPVHTGPDGRVVPGRIEPARP